MTQTQEAQFELIKAGAFSVYAEAGVPEAQWDTKLASYLDAVHQAQRSAQVIPLIKQALANA